MLNLLAGIGMGVMICVVAYAAFRFRSRWTSGGKRRKGPAVTVHGSVEDMRSVGELSVYKIYTKEIVTATDHWFGEIGQRYFEWMISSRKMAMIIAFDIDFRYDLQSANFVIHAEPDGRYRLQMPPCCYETSIKDVLFYDEQNSRLLPWLLPDLLNRAFGAGFSESDKNRLIEEAKDQAGAQSRELVKKMRSELQSSARRTLGALAKGFGAGDVTIDFRESDLVQLAVEYPEPRESAPESDEAAA